MGKNVGLEMRADMKASERQKEQVYNLGGKTACVAHCECFDRWPRAMTFNVKLAVC